VFGYVAPAAIGVVDPSRGEGGALVGRFPFGLGFQRITRTPKGDELGFRAYTHGGRGTGKPAHICRGGVSEYRVGGFRAGLTGRLATGAAKIDERHELLTVRGLLTIDIAAIDHRLRLRTMW